MSFCFSSRYQRLAKTYGPKQLSLSLGLLQDWESETSICKAFAIGKTESKAVVQLCAGMNTTIREKLEEAVRRYGMRAFIYHDVIARECFSRGYSSVTPGMEAWAKQLTNSSKDTDPLVA